jgi:hypothetical protein
LTTSTVASQYFAMLLMGWAASASITPLWISRTP